MPEMLYYARVIFLFVYFNYIVLIAYQFKCNINAMLYIALYLILYDS